jgi:carbon monoxide dehydrogenase subunit G
VNLHRSLAIQRPRAEVFELIGDGERYAEFFAGLTRWERLPGDESRYRVLTCVGPVQAGGVVRVTERRDDEVLAWESETGIEQAGRWRLEPAGGEGGEGDDGGGTVLHLEISFRLLGPGSRLAERLMARVVARNMESTLLAVRRMVEFDRRVQAAT